MLGVTKWGIGMIKVILWDIDGTLLNFRKAECVVIRKCFESFGMGECTDEMIERYSAINKGYWERLERGELSKAEALKWRFRDFFQEEGLPIELAADFNREFQLRMGDAVFFQDNGYELVQELRGRVKQYAVTNGTKMAQKRKLENSGLNQLLDGVFISDEIGLEKPAKGFFEHVWTRIGPYEKQEILIVGDSLTSDMLGGNRAGILCCWYNPAGLVSPKDLKIDHEIKNLWQVKELL